MNSEILWFLCHISIWLTAFVIVTDADAWRSGNWKRILYGE